MKNMTYFHEHVRINLSGIKKDLDCDLCCFDETVAEFKILKDKGVANIVEVTNLGMGRDAKFMSDVAKASGINIIMSTGFYKEPFLPDYFDSKTEEELSEMMILDIEKGMDGTDIKASVIGEVGTSLNKITEQELKLFLASILAHKKTGAPISTHTSLGTMGKEQAEIFKSKKVDPARVYLGHIDLSKSVENASDLINMGFYIGFDTIGKKAYFEDEKRCEILKELQNRNQLDHVMLSMDITRRSHLKAFGGLSYSFLLDEFVPMMSRYGIKDRSIERLLIENPKTFLNL